MLITGLQKFFLPKKKKLPSSMPVDIVQVLQKKILRKQRVEFNYTPGYNFGLV